MWVTITMNDLWEKTSIHNTKDSIWIKPVFPCRRWGHVYTKTSTTDKTALEKQMPKLIDIGIKCRKRICKESSEKFKNLGKFYKIETYNK